MYLFFLDPNVVLQIWRCLHAVLVPTGQKRHNKSNKIWKFSIADSQDAFIKNINSFGDVHSEIEQFKIKCVEHNITVQPLIFIVDDTNVYVAYDDIVYKLSSYTTSST